MLRTMTFPRLISPLPSTSVGRKDHGVLQGIHPSASQPVQVGKLLLIAIGNSFPKIDINVVYESQQHKEFRLYCE